MFWTSHWTKGWPRSYPGYCLHLWNPPQQPLHHSQECHCIWDNYNQSVSQHCGGFDDPSSIASRASIFVFGSGDISTANFDEIRFLVSNALGHYSVLNVSLVLKSQYVSIECWQNVLQSIRGLSVKVIVPDFQGQIGEILWTKTHCEKYQSLMARGCHLYT